MTEKEEKFAQAIAKLHLNQIEQDKCILSCDSISIKFWQIELKSLLENEPFYMFKKEHKKWEEKIKDTKEHINNLYEKFDGTLEELEKFNDSLNK